MGETTCQVWFLSQNGIVRVLTGQLSSLVSDDASIEINQLMFAAAASRVADAAGDAAGGNGENFGAACRHEAFLLSVYI